MVEGVEVKVPSFFWPVTCFVMFLALMNPFVKLKCIGPHCKTDFVSEFDGVNYTIWADGGAWKQAHGNLTIEKLTHGLVNCESKCDDCGKDDCKNWDYGGMRKLDEALHYHGSALPSFITSMCYCADFCVNCTGGLIPLPGNNTANSKWIDMDCKALEATFNETEGRICGLVELYRSAYIIFVTCLVFMVLLQFTMLVLEYVNFDSFLDGRCRCLFCPYWVKKSLYILMAIVCLAAQLYTFLTLVKDTNDKLDDYFEVINGDFDYDWNTRGYHLFITAIVGSCVTICTMVFAMPKVERQKKKSYRNDIHGISTESVLARKF